MRDIYRAIIEAFIGNFSDKWFWLEMIALCILMMLGVNFWLLFTIITIDTLIKTKNLMK